MQADLKFGDASRNPELRQEPRLGPQTNARHRGVFVAQFAIAIAFTTPLVVRFERPNAHLLRKSFRPCCGVVVKARRTSDKCVGWLLLAEVQIHALPDRGEKPAHQKSQVPEMRQPLHPMLRKSG